MKTLEQIKNEFSNSKGFEDYDDILVSFSYSQLSLHKFKQYENEVMKIYAMECLKLASENFDDRTRSEITNENNIIK